MAEEELIPDPPRKGDILFRDGFPDWQNNACLGFPGSDEHGYTEGYRRGARFLVEHVIEDARDQDYLVYPIIFLYRHHIELALKNIIVQASYVIDRKLTDVEQKHFGKHRLDWRWQDLKPMLAEVCKAAAWNKLSHTDIEGIDSYILQITKLDPDSFSFRYTRSKTGAPSLPSQLHRINLRHFAELMERLADYLDALDTAVGVLSEGKMEAEADWRNEAASYMESYGDYE